MAERYAYDLTREEWEEYLSGVPKYRAGQIYDALHKGIPFDKINVPKELKERIKAEFRVELPEVVKELKSKDGTTKFLLKLHDGEMIECVLLRQDYGNTVCISTQVGCKMNCAFCASGADGFVRDLSAGEMLSQVLMVGKVTNVVLMGSGEPFDNFDNVVKFLRLTDVGARHISLSTAGIVPKIREFADLGLQVNRCISLHAPTDEIRQRIMPVSKKWRVNELIEAAKYFFEKTRRRVIFEYALIDGVNCEVEHAVALAKLVKGFPSHVNLINLNSTGGEYRAPCREVAKQFMDALIKAGASCTMRKSKGEDIMAACGQLKRQVGSEAKSEIQIRKTTLDDVEHIVKLGNAVWRSAYAHILPKKVFDEKDAKVDERIKQAKEIGVNTNDRIDLVAVCGDKIVAFVTGTVVSGYDRYKEMDYADLMAIYVDPECQHAGLGRILFDKVVAFFKEQKRKHMVIGVLKENTQALKAYEKWGGKLDTYEMPFTRSGFTTTEVFYIFDLN